MKNKKHKSKINKWKLTAIISLVVNFIVALLLTIGLAKPKSYVKTLAVSDNLNLVYSNEMGNVSEKLSYFNTGAFKTYMSSLAHQHPSDFASYTEFNYYFDLGYGGELVAGTDYSFADYKTFNRVEVSFNDETSYLYSVYAWNTITQYGTFFYAFGEYNYRSDSLHFFRTSNSNSSFKLFLDKLFFYMGTTEAYKDYLIRDNWNPNKYISIASDSIGLLFDSPSTSSWLPLPRVKWVSPTYYHDYNLPSGRVQKVSTLGYFEFPLLFESNGELFNGIRLYYDVYHHYIDKDGNVKHTSPETSAVGGITTNAYHYGFVYMSYTYELTTALGAPLTTFREKVVSAVPVYQILQDISTDNIEYREYIYQPFEPYKWLNNEFKVIHTFDYSKPQLERIGVNEIVSRSRIAINQLTIEQVLEYDMAVSGSPVGSSTYLGDAFSLIRDAFASILPILSLSILPNITIGMLIFIPLVLTIIIVVIKLVKR